MVDKWQGKFAVVTGASAGIGAAIAKDLSANGIHVIGLARRPEKIEELAKQLGETPGKIHAYKCDVTDLQSIKEAFRWIEERFGAIHILVNNSGVIRKIKILSDGDDVSAKIEEVINTNFTGLVHVTREAFRLMKKSNDYGYICNVNSNAGHKVPFPVDPDMSHNVYNGSKHAITATSEVLRQELICMGNDKIRVTVSVLFSSPASFLFLSLHFSVAVARRRCNRHFRSWWLQRNWLELLQQTAGNQS